MSKFGISGSAVAAALGLDACEGDYVQTRDIAGPIRPSGAMAFNYVIQHLMTGEAWTRFSIAISNLSGAEELKFYNGGTLIKTIRVTCVTSGSDTEIIFADPEFILTEAGDFLLQENGDKIIQEQT